MIRLSIFIFTTIIFLALSCAPTYAPVYPEPVNIKTIIKPGDTVKVTTKDNIEYEFEVVNITEDSIIGKSVTLRFEDIDKYQKMVESSGKRTAKSVGVLVIGIPLLVIGVAAEQAILY
jgi:PDZ domain-containing secreted protein